MMHHRNGISRTRRVGENKLKDKLKDKLKTFRSLRHHLLTVTYENTLDLVLVATNPAV